MELTPKVEHSSNTVNVVIQAANGQQQLIKIMRNPNGQPLTPEGFKAIVKEVTGQDASKVIMGKNIGTSKPKQFVTLSGTTNNSNITSSTSSSSSNNSSPNTSIVQKFNMVPLANKMSAVVKSLRPAAPSHIKQSLTKTIPTNVTNYSTMITANSGLTSPVSTKKMSPTPSGTIRRRRKTDRVGKGLRHFSMKVCEKVKEKGSTTYNEVADELVEEEAKGQPIDPTNFDQKNIRRRVYDALNVLMAMNIISKDKKEIRWIGLPVNSAQQCSDLEKENLTRKERIEAKQQQLRELILQQVSFKSLVSRNKEQEERGLVPSPSSAIQMPFIIVNTHKKTNINCSISNDKSEYHFKFNDKFEIHDDIEVLKRMGLLLGLDKGECTYHDIERAKTMVPKTFQKYIEIYGKGQDEMLSDEWDLPSSQNDDAGYVISKLEPLSDEEDIDEEHYTDASDME